MFNVLLVKYSVGSVGCVGFVELNGVECIFLLSFRWVCWVC